MKIHINRFENAVWNKQLPILREQNACFDASQITFVSRLSAFSTALDRWIYPELSRVFFSALASFNLLVTYI